MAYRTEKQHEAEENEALVRRIDKLAGVLHERERLAALVGISPATFRRRMKNPEDFTVAEIRAFARIERMKYGKEETEPWLIAGTS